MRKLLTILLLSPLSLLAQTHYYISASGNDANNGTSTATPWQTLTKVNSVAKVAGDIFSFNGGDVFYGYLTASASGTSTSPITYNSYGTGRATITGLTSISGWTSLGGNIWESTSSVSSLGSCNMVLVNGNNTGMGRWPNTGYLNIDSHSGDTTITSSSLTGTPNWAGAKVAMKREDWYIEVDSIKSQSGSTITFTNEGTYPVQTNWGYFIEASPSTLDTANEWYYNPSTGKLRIYSTATPTNIQLSTVDKTFQNPSNYTYIVIDNLNFKGANNTGIDMNYGAYETITNDSITFCGERGIYLDGASPVVKNNTVYQIGYTGIQVDQNGSSALIQSNNVKKVYPVAGSQSLNAGGGSSLYIVSAGGMVKFNNVDSSGWGGINVYGNNDSAMYNFVNHSALLRDDCGGLATHHGYTGVYMYHNIILNTIGEPSGTNGGGNKLAHGIYLDDLSTFVILDGNTVEGCNGVGIMNHRSHDNTIINNTVYNNNYSQSNFTKGQIWFQYNDTPGFKNYQIKNNIFFAANSNQSIWNYYSSPTNSQALNAFGTEDSNYYTTTATGNLFFTNDGGVVNNYTLPGWQTYTGGDAHSTANVFTNTQLFVYNATNHDSTISLSYSYQDVKGNAYNTGSIVLHAYSSAVLLQTGTLAVPTISMSGDQPALTSTSTSVSATGTPSSGQTITGYQWSQVSGPVTVSFGNPTSPSTTVNGMTVSGTYVEQCVVTQSNGGTATGQVTLTTTISNGNSTNIIIRRGTKRVVL